MAQRPKSDRATIDDVAKEAGVSRAAVSKVIRRAYGVSEDMKQRVEAAISELGYRPQTAARAMRGQTYTLGVLLPDFANPFYPTIIDGIIRHLADTPYTFMVSPATDDATIQTKLISSMIDHQMDGLILLAPTLADAKLDAIASQIPVVMIGRHSRSTHFDSVVGDDTAGARLVVDHLVKLGHRRIAHITHRDPGRWQGTMSVQAIRAASYRQAMVEHGLTDETDVVTGTYTEPGGYQAACELFSRTRPPTAIFAGADVAAFGVYRAADEFGLHIAQDISIAGYDNTSVAALSPISLTTVEQSGSLLGAESARLLLERIEGRSSAAHLSFQPRLITRTSTAAPARVEPTTTPGQQALAP